MHLATLAVPLMALAAAHCALADSVLLASRRAGAIEAISLETLETVARVRTPRLTESVASDPSGLRLFVAAPREPQGSCCALFSLDPPTMRLTELAWPAQGATVTANNLFLQRGSVGIEVIDLRILKPLAKIATRAHYELRASPDGRLLFGIEHGPQVSLALFDVARGSTVATQMLPEGANLAGAWVGRQYFLFSTLAGQARVQPVSSETSQTGGVVSLSPAISFASCVDYPVDAIAAGVKLAIYAQFGLTSDGICTGAGGFALADPVSGAASAHLASGFKFRQMVASDDGAYLYGLDVGKAEWRDVRIVKVEAATGKVAAEKKLEPDVWYLTKGAIPTAMAGRLDLTALPPQQKP
jgi:hypothetical protein